MGASRSSGLVPATGRSPLEPRSVKPASPLGEVRGILLPTTRHLLPLGLCTAGLFAYFVPGYRVPLLAFCLVLLVLWRVFHQLRASLVLDGQGYRVEVKGQVKFSVPYGSLRRVVVLDAGSAHLQDRGLFLDAGDPARNLLIPPLRGYAFTYSNREEILNYLLEVLPKALPPSVQLESPSEFL